MGWHLNGGLHIGSTRAGSQIACRVKLSLHSSAWHHRSPHLKSAAARSIRRMIGYGTGRAATSRRRCSHVRFAPKADEQTIVSACPLCADFVAEVAEEEGPLCLGAEHEP